MPQKIGRATLGLEKMFVVLIRTPSINISSHNSGSFQVFLPLFENKLTSYLVEGEQDAHDVCIVHFYPNWFQLFKYSLWLWVNDCWARFNSVLSHHNETLWQADSKGAVTACGRWIASSFVSLTCSSRAGDQSFTLDCSQASHLSINDHIINITEHNLQWIFIRASWA